MKALVLQHKGEFPKAFEVENPIPGANEALVSLENAALNRRDYWITQGQYSRVSLPVILGSDGAGLVDGQRVLINPGWSWGAKEEFQSRDFKVLGMPDSGTLAQYISVPIEYIRPVPSHLTWEEAAALPLAGVTAYRALVTRGAVRPRCKVFISGIGGGVATMALLLALSYGAEVFVSSSSAQKRKKALTLGASGAVDYTSNNWVDELKSMSGGLDLIIDGAGGEGVSQLLRICNYGAKIVLYGGTTGHIPDLSPQIVFWKQLEILGSTMGSPADFDAMLDQVELTEIRPIVDSVFAFDESPKAFQRLAEGSQFGKIVIQIPK